MSLSLSPGELPTMAQTAAPTEDGPRATPSTAIRLGAGSQVGRYVVIGLLGAGGMGVVYAAYDPQLDRKIALKLLLPARSGRDSMGRQRLLREAQAMAQLTHPNVVTVHDVGEHEQGVFVAMEFVQGRTLRQWLDDRPRGWREVLAVFMDAGRGLVAAHAAKLVHRDFKPENVMVGDDGRVRVLDFGLVRPLEGDRRDEALGGADLDGPVPVYSVDGVLLGTPAYMAPEQLMGMTADERSDQFSFCVALYEGLCGQRPFAGDSLAELADNVLASRSEPFPRRSDVPVWVRRAVRAGLAREPDARHASMEALLVILQRDPSRARRRWFIGGAVAATALVGAGTYSWHQASVEAACERQGRALAAEWTDERRGRVQRALAGHDVPFAAETWERVEPALDRYVSTWAEASEAACRAHRVEGRWSAALVERAAHCLAERRAAFSSLVDILSEPNLEVLIKAGVAVGSLPAVHECADELALRRRPAAPVAARERALAVRRETMRGMMEAAVGRLGSGRDRLEAALIEAQALERPALIAGVEQRLASVLHSQGAYAEAAALMRRSYFGFGRAGDQAAQLRLAAFLVRTEANLLGRDAVAEDWLEHAQMLHARVAEPHEPEAYDLTWARATVLAVRGDYDAALEQAQRAHAQAAEVLGVEHPDVDTLQTTITDIQNRRGEYALALTQTRERLGRLRQLLGPHHPKVARALINVATLELQLGELDRGQATASEALRLTEQSMGPEHHHTASALRTLATARYRGGEVDEAIALLERAITILERKGALGGELLTTQVVLGGLLVQQAQHPRAIELLEEARGELLKRHGQDHPELLGVLINLGAAYRGRGDVAGAIETYTRALEVGEEVLDPGHPSLAYPLNNLGGLERERGNFDESRSLLERALEIRRAKLDDEHPLIASSLVNLAKLDLAQGRAEDASARLEEARRILDASGASPDKMIEVEQLSAQARLQGA